MYLVAHLCVPSLLVVNCPRRRSVPRLYQRCLRAGDLLQIDQTWKIPARHGGLSGKTLEKNTCKSRIFQCKVLIAKGYLRY